jgi:Anti-sigma factor NepR
MQIGRQLREMYQDSVQSELPDKILRLLEDQPLWVRGVEEGEGRQSNLPAT